MFQRRIYDIADEDFASVREDLTRSVYGLPLAPNLESGTRITLTTVHPNGEFFSHKDEYHHVFYFIDGKGIGWIGDEKYEIRPGRVARIPAGTLHGYRNDSTEPMVLLTVNIPISEC